MSASLVSTIGAPNANSYISNADALAYFCHTIFNADWVALGAAQDTFLMAATKIIDYTFEFHGVRADSTRPQDGGQRLKHPRTGLIYDGVVVEDDEIHFTVQEATAQLALDLSKDSGILDSLKRGGIKEVKLDELFVKFRESFEQSYFPISDQVRMMLSPFIQGGITSNKFLLLR